MWEYAAWIVDQQQLMIEYDGLVRDYQAWIEEYSIRDKLGLKSDR